MARRRRTPDPADLTATRYKLEAEALRVELATQRAADAPQRVSRDRVLEALEKRVKADDERVASSVSALREARERNHFTERMRYLFNGGR